MQTPQQLPHNEVWDLRVFHAPRNDQSEVTTTSKQKFTYADHCQMAYMMWQRMGKNNDAFHRGWCRFMESNPSLSDVMALVANYVYTTLDQ